MADKEMIAATLAAALITGGNVTVFHSLAGTAVELYHQVLDMLERPRISAANTDEVENSN
jgi:hypothetical protein